MRGPCVRRSVVVAVGAALVLASWSAGRCVARTHRATEFAHAVGLAPAGTERISWTDWAASRAGSDVDARVGVDALDRFLDEAYDPDLSSASALVQSAPVLQEQLRLLPGQPSTGSSSPSPRRARW